MAGRSARASVLAAGAITALLGWGSATTPAQAQHGGYYGGYDGPRHGPSLQFGPGGVQIDGGERHHRPRRHAHCREIEYRDHHGRYRVRTECED